MAVKQNRTGLCKQKQDYRLAMVQERGRLAAVDLAAAKQEAAAAKAGGDRTGQQAAGIRIRDLKKELQELGVAFRQTQLRSQLLNCQAAVPRRDLVGRCC